MIEAALGGRNTTRRKLMKKSAILGSAGMIGTGAFSTSAAALHCDAPNDDNYIDEASEGQSSSDDNIKLTTGTDFAHMRTVVDGDRVAHTFYFATTATSEYDYSGDPVNAITEHAVNVDASSIGGTTEVDFCQSNTGIYPEGDTQSNENFEEIADLALNAMDALSKNVPYGLATSDVFTDNYNKDFDDSLQQGFSLTRRGSPQVDTKVQGMFEVAHDTNEAGRVYFTSDTEGYRYTVSSAATPSTSHYFSIYCDEDFVTIDTTPPGSP
jgi:hypothetical protein